MGDKSRIASTDSFPEDLTDLRLDTVEVLNSKVHRQLDKEYVEEGFPHPETDARHEDLTEELDRRDDD